MCVGDAGTTIWQSSFVFLRRTSGHAQERCLCCLLWQTICKGISPLRKLWLVDAAFGSPLGAAGCWWWKSAKVFPWLLLTIGKWKVTCGDATSVGNLISGLSALSREEGGDTCSLLGFFSSLQEGCLWESALQSLPEALCSSFAFVGYWPFLDWGFFVHRGLLQESYLSQPSCICDFGHKVKGGKRHSGEMNSSKP